MQYLQYHEPIPHKPLHNLYVTIYCKASKWPVHKSIPKD